MSTVVKFKNDQRTLQFVKYLDKEGYKHEGSHTSVKNWKPLMPEGELNAIAFDVETKLVYGYCDPAYWVRQGHDVITEKEFFKQKESENMGRRTFRLLKETAELRKGALVQEACDDGDQEYVALSYDDLKVSDHEEYFDNPPSFSRETVETQPKWFEEVFPATATYLSKSELSAFKDFLKTATKKK